MEHPLLPQTPQRLAASGLIAWLSVCILAAAWSGTLDEQWQTPWTIMGALGLIAAFGFTLADRDQVLKARQSHKLHLPIRLQGGASRLEGQSAALDSINAAVRRLAEHAVRERHGQFVQPGRVKRWQSLLLRDYPFEMLSVEERPDGLACSDEPPTVGALRQISSRTISFEHSELAQSRLVLLTFRLGEEEHISFVVDVVWTQNSGGGFASTGTLLAVGIPSHSLPASSEVVPSA